MSASLQPDLPEPEMLDAAGFISPVKELFMNGFFSIDRNWTVMQWNRAAEKIMDMPAEAIIGKNIWEVFADKLPVEFYAEYHQAFLNDIPRHFHEYWGELGKWFEVVTTHDFDRLYVSFKCSGTPVYMGDTERGVRIMNDLYRYMAQITNECLWDWDLKEKNIFWIDGGHRRVFQYPIENASIAQSFWESCIHPNDRESVMKKFRHDISIREQNYWEAAYRFKRSDGTFAYVQDKGRIIFDREGKAVRIIGATLDITEVVTLQKKLQEQHIQKQLELTEAVLTAHENEREIIGKELHDNLGQLLLVAKLYVQMSDSAEGAHEFYLGKSISLLNEVIEEVRRISRILVVPASNILSLFENIKVLIKDLERVQPIRIRFLTDGVKPADIPPKLQLAIYRIIQEQINNIIKYAETAHATIAFRRSGKQLILDISDTGKGCDLNLAAKGVGLINICSRVELLKGLVKLKSAPGKGFSIHIALPMEPVT